MDATTTSFSPTADSVLEKFEELRKKSNKRIILFNKESGAYVSTIITKNEELLDSDYYKWKVIHFDDYVYEWQGDYDTGGLIKIEDKPTVIDEESVDRQIGSVITESYPVFSQLNILMGVIRKLIDVKAVKGDEVDEFIKMFDFIEGRREQNRKYKTAYAEDPDFILVTRRDKWNTLAQQLAGGLSEVVGPARSLAPHTDETNDVDVLGQHY
jgi:hypothetical protein